MNGGVMGTIGAVIGLVMNWGDLAQTAIGALVGAVVAILVNETWKWIKRLIKKRRAKNDD